MNNKLSCEVVRDLLPSYVDGLTSSATNSAVEEHLKECEPCSDALRRMKAPEQENSSINAELDYLKKVRRRSRTVSLLIGILLMLLGMSMIFYRCFYIGSKAQATDALCSVSVSGSSVTLSGTLTSSGLGVSRVTFSDSNGMVQAKIYTAPIAFFNSGDFSAQYTAGSEVGQVRVDDLILWEEGTEISPITAQLFAARSPYVGDMPSNGRIANILGVSDQFGSYSNELQTDTKPYGWTLDIDAPLASDEEDAARSIMQADSCAMLASIDNLGYVTWKYKTEAGAQEFIFSAEDATAMTGQDIKSFGSSVSQLQSLMQSLSLKWSGVREVLQEDGTFRLNIRNYSGSPIYGLSMNYYLNGKLIGSRGLVNADGSRLKDDSIEFEFIPKDFPDGTSAVSLSGFSFDLSVIDKDGRETPVAEGVKLSAKYAWTFFFSLDGSFENGFSLNAG